MASVKPLRLRVQKSTASASLTNSGSGANGVAENLPFAKVLVDTPAFHLENSFDYLIPEALSKSATVGTLVKVAFGNSMTRGYIISRSSTASEMLKLRAIEAVISPIPVLTKELLDLLTRVADRYGCRIWDLIPGAIPERVASAEKIFEKDQGAEQGQVEECEKNTKASYFSSADLANLGNRQQIRWLVTPKPGVDFLMLMHSILATRTSIGQILIVVPDERDLLAVANMLTENLVQDVAILGSHLTRSSRYLNFLKVCLNSPKVILGTRSAIFSPLSANSTIIVLSDVDESMYERRNPGWNVRDIALLRGVEHSLIFLAFSSSLEVARLVSIGWIQRVQLNQTGSLRVISNSSHKNEMNVIAEGLKTGSVIICVSDPGYVNGFLCQKCRNPAICDCGGRLIMQKTDQLITCATCSKAYLDWKCSWCGESKPWLIKRGAKRLAQEFGKAFPNISVITSTGDKSILQLPVGKHLVLATSGCEPYGKYSAAALLDANILLNRTQLRSTEISYERWFRVASFLSPGSELFVSLASDHPFVQAVTRNDSLSLAVREIELRTEVHLPPEYRIATIEGVRSDIIKLAETLTEQISLEILGPIPINLENSKLVLKCNVERSQELSLFVHDLMRYRSLKNLPAFRIRVDPFEI